MTIRQFQYIILSINSILSRSFILFLFSGFTDILHFLTFFALYRPAAHALGYKILARSEHFLLFCLRSVDELVVASLYLVDELCVNFVQSLFNWLNSIFTLQAA